MKAETRVKLEARLKYYRDIGIPAFYRDRAGGDLKAAATQAGQKAQPFASPSAAQGKQAAPVQRAEAGSGAASSAPTKQTGAASSAPARQMGAASSAPTAKAAVVLPVVQAAGLFDAAERVEGDSLARIQADIGPDCTRCTLHRRRNKIVFGVGNPRAELVFVGEGPGADEDAQGEPFVGRAGKLLTQMIEAMGLRRDDVYICNVVKCRPPENRTPENDEIATCSAYLLRQLEVIKPKVIVCLGSVAAKTLLGTHSSMGKLRQQWFEFRSAKLLATYHPAYCLRNPPSKADVWKDLQLAMVELGLELPKKKK